MKKGLLDEIAEGAESYCLSNLHTMEYRKKVYSAVMKLEAADYGVTEWEESIRYILLDSVDPFENQEEAKHYLLNHLRDDES